MRNKFWESPYSDDPNWKKSGRGYIPIGLLEDVPLGFPINERVVFAIHQDDMELLPFLKEFRLRPINYLTNWRGTFIQFKTESDAIKFRLLWPETEIVKQ
jgi:hypothetical protein